MNQSYNFKGILHPNTEELKLKYCQSWAWPEQIYESLECAFIEMLIFKQHSHRLFLSFKVFYITENQLLTAITRLAIEAFNVLRF